MTRSSIAARSRRLRRGAPQVAVAGGGTCPPSVARVAQQLGSGLAELGATVVCGGLGGVMQAVALGVRQRGGLVIGILPEYDRRSGNRHLSAAIELLKRQPDTAERARQELTLLLTLGPALMAARGQASQEVEANYRRALALCEQGRQTPYVFSAQLGLWAFYQLRARYQVALPLGKRLLGLALQSQRPKQLAEGHRVLGATLFRLGKLDAARSHMRAARPSRDGSAPSRSRSSSPAASGPSGRSGSC